MVELTNNDKNPQLVEETKGDPKPTQQNPASIGQRLKAGIQKKLEAESEVYSQFNILGKVKDEIMEYLRQMEELHTKILNKL